MLFLKRSCLYHVLGWPWGWRSTALLWNWWEIMQKTEVSEFSIQTNWCKTLIWAGWKTRGSAWISKIVGQRRHPVKAWTPWAYKWYIGIWFWHVRIGFCACMQTFSSSCDWWSVFNHDNEVSHVIKLNDIQISSFCIQKNGLLNNDLFRKKLTWGFLKVQPEYYNSSKFSRGFEKIPWTSAVFFSSQHNSLIDWNIKISFLCQAKFTPCYHPIHFSLWADG